MRDGDEHGSIGGAYKISTYRRIKYVQGYIAAKMFDLAGQQLAAIDREDAHEPAVRAVSVQLDRARRALRNR